ncbi:hypothetical protein [Paenibacillus agilis]|uniref:Uncharacterized protein n=1 Tax=Paenibacillus agilis TaxID=3020863 RepID=A0A559J1Q7_9BACL|nr:hypothetical protein [Paenibacillus agilis]TVX93809.1 hypothetical protein FPZ44_12550 [Paenibacillus agilis]
MNKKYEIKLPKLVYVQVMISILIISPLLLALRKDDLFSVIFSTLLLLSILVQVVILMRRILRKNNKLEIKENTIKINQREIPIQKIEKIIIEGYFVQSIGIKLYGSKLVSIDLHFRFKNNEEIHIEELKQWAKMNRLKVTSGKIFRWI